MHGWKRAFLYLVRQRGRTAILFAILFVMLALTLIGFSIIGAASGVTAQMRRNLGGWITLTREKNSDDPYVTDDTIAALEMTAGVKEVNAMDAIDLYFPDLTLIAGANAGTDMGHVAPLSGNTKSDWNAYFLYGVFRVAEGRALTAEDRGKALISQNVASASGLSVGDVIVGYRQTDPDAFDMENGYAFEIVGIYQVQYEAAAAEGGLEWEIPANTIYVDNDAIYDIRQRYDSTRYDGAQRYPYGATVFVGDPLVIEDIAEAIRSRTDLGLDRLDVTVDDSVYQAASAPLARVEALVRALSGVVLCVCAVLLALILTLWVRNRMHEVGIYLSIGIPKRNILGQLLIECLSVTLVAFALAYPVSLLTGARLGASLYKTMAAQGALEAAEADADEAVVVAEESEDFDARVSPQAFLAAAGAGLCIVALAATLSAAQIFRMNPKTILSSMS